MKQKTDLETPFMIISWWV